MVEDIFAEGMRFQVARHAARDAPGGIFQDWMLGQPAGALRRRSALFQSVQKGMGDEWVGRPRSIAARILATRTGIPGRRRHVGDAMHHAHHRAVFVFW